MCIGFTDPAFWLVSVSTALWYFATFFHVNAELPGKCMHADACVCVRCACRCESLACPFIGDTDRSCTVVKIIAY